MPDVVQGMTDTDKGIEIAENKSFSQQYSMRKDYFMSGIIDFHAHAFPEAIAQKAVEQIGNHYSIKMRGKGLIEDLIESAKKSAVEYVVIHATATRPAQVKNINDWIAQNANGMLIGFGTLHPDMEDIEEEFERIISMGLKGIKLHPEFQGFFADDDKMDRVYRTIGDRLPVLIHAGDENYDNSSPRRIANVLDKFPKITFIVAHLGGHKKWQEALEYLVGRNIYFDTSSALQFMDKSLAEMLIKKHGTKKIVFGTDYPIIYHDKELEYFHNLGLSDEEKQDILYNNASYLLKI